MQHNSQMDAVGVTDSLGPSVMHQISCEPPLPPLPLPLPSPTEPLVQASHPQSNLLLSVMTAELTRRINLGENSGPNIAPPLFKHQLLYVRLKPPPS